MFPNDAIYCFRDISRYKTLNPGCNTELNEMPENRNGKIDKEYISWKKSIEEVLLKNKTKSQRGC